MENFGEALRKKIVEVQFNNFGAENYDELRFGKIDKGTFQPDGLLEKTKKKVKKVIGYNKNKHKQIAEKILNDFSKYAEGLEIMYTNLKPLDRELLVSLIAYRTVGFNKVKLPRNNKAYWEALETAKKLKYNGETYDPHFMHFILEKFNLQPVGYDIQLFFSEVGIAIDFIIEQYSHKAGNNILVEAELGDIVLDIGGCWGDTALYFAHKVGEKGKVFSFEFIPDNIKLHNINTGLNPHLRERIQLVDHPITNCSGDTIYFKDNGPGSRIEPQPFEGQTGYTTTLNVDDFVSQKKLQRVDFIKMDIEGAEPIALQGAIKTIKKYKPKLAIATYHSMEDFVYIPRWILDLDLGYEIFLGHYTIHAEETICFAKQKTK